jgi:hypothetical protein
MGLEALDAFGQADSRRPWAAESLRRAATVFFHCWKNSSAATVLLPLSMVACSRLHALHREQHAIGGVQALQLLGHELIALFAQAADGPDGPLHDDEHQDARGGQTGGQAKTDAELAKALVHCPLWATTKTKDFTGSSASSRKT